MLPRMLCANSNVAGRASALQLYRALLALTVSLGALALTMFHSDAFVMKDVHWHCTAEQRMLCLTTHSPDTAAFNVVLSPVVKYTNISSRIL